MTDDLGGFEAAVRLHEQLLRRPDPEAAAAQLCPGRLDPPTRWTADLHPIRAYQAIDPTRLSLAGYDDFHAIPDASLDAAIEGVVDAEGPVHFDTLADRLLAAADVGRLGSRIRERIEARLQALSATPDLSQRGGFVARPAQFLKPPYRDWHEAPEKTRRLEAVSDEELMLALFRAVLDGNANDAETAECGHPRHRIHAADGQRARSATGTTGGPARWGNTGGGGRRAPGGNVTLSSR
jgi:hypothetical protein